MIMITSHCATPQCGWSAQSCPRHAAIGLLVVDPGSTLGSSFAIGVLVGLNAGQAPGVRVTLGCEPPHNAPAYLHTSLDSSCAVDYFELPRH